MWVGKVWVDKELPENYRPDCLPPKRKLNRKKIYGKPGVSHCTGRTWKAYNEKMNRLSKKAIVIDEVPPFKRGQEQ